MTYVRKVRTASGAVAVQVARKNRGRVEIIEHVGSAHTDAELSVLLARARRIVDGEQGVLDFEVSTRIARVDEVADWRSEPERTAAATVAPAGRTLGTSSRLLYEVLGAVYDRLGFDEVGDTVFRDLVIARIVEPTSKADSARVLDDLGADTVSYKTIQRHLVESVTRDYRNIVATRCFARAAASGDLSLILYDVTTLYFEAEKEDDLRKVGYSKERRVDPQIVVGLLVDRTGFPLEIGCFEGNTAETTTIVPIVRQFQQRHGLGDAAMVVAADAGMLSTANLTDLDAAGVKFIVGSRVTKAPDDLASHFHWYGDLLTDGQIIDTITPRHGRSTVNNVRTRAEPVWDPTTHPNGWRAVWQYSRKRAVRDAQTLNLQEARARAVIDGTKPAKATRFVTVTTKGRRLDTASIERARSLVGLKGYVSNLPVAVMDSREVIAKYHDLWHVEQSFRMSKTDLRARPMFHRTRDAIEAHLTIVFAALAVAREVQDHSGLGIGNVVKQLRPLRTSTIVINGATESFPPQIPAAQQKILADLGFAGY
ncbi:IS1634 family transposase [Rhodococcus rhodochrous]|uniref:IS1634 family transposase n=1 Tax=Rhodococcus rhodochrous TaxID=1829 RepID=UPI000D06771A|nr:IS1634 family transposase [Rhodococcus rhodochrous]AYA23376.1 IS1634 family transposase [Rhodococcus rhodochrous]